ncbi:WD domain, G-beta repeat [Popillia japonica]|uniref:Serine-threonine kinase receptor-associated protein n=1 Tax=Popillia japonica TaxID=7064 RepID=A0AAW1JZY5_POPJA
MANLRQTPLTCSGHTRPVVHLDFSSVTDSGYFLISACKDGKPMLRQGETGDWIGTFEGHKGAVWGVALNPEATRAASGAADFTGKVWDAITGEELHSFQHNHIVKSVNFSKDTALLATGSNEKLVKIFDLQKPEASPDEVQKLEFPSNPNSLEVSRDGSVLTVAHSNTVTFLNADNVVTKIKDFTIPTTVNSASLHPDKSIFVAGGDDLKVYKFDYITGTEIESFKGHFGPVHCVRFSPDGELYASGSEDGTLRLWQTNIGKTYGLWKCVDGSQLNNDIASPKEVPAS